MRTRILQVAGGVLIGLLLSLFWLSVSRPVPGPPPGADVEPGGMLPEPFAPPPITGVDTEGDSLSTADLRGRSLAVFFGYTSCPDVCPLTLARLARYREELPAAARDGFEVLFVSVDPARDTPARVGEYVRGLPAGVRGLIADDIEAQARSWGVLATPGAEYAEGEYLVDHTARTFILDPEGRITATIPPMAEGTTVAEILDAVLGRSG